MNSTLSKTIGMLRFPLAALIVLKHYYTPDISAETLVGGGNSYTYYHFIGAFFTHIFQAFAVPLFFFMSGYLYFNKLELAGENGYTLDVWKRKTKGRIKSLLIPYLSWNLLVLLLYFVAQQMTSGSDVMAKDGYKLIADYGIMDYAKAMYALDSTGFPIDGPLWFIRDLFIVSVFVAPLIYLWIKYCKMAGMILLTVAYLAGLNIPISGMSFGAVFFVAWGGYMSLHKNNLGVETEGVKANLMVVPIVIALSTFTYATFGEVEWVGISKKLYILATVACVFGFIGQWVKKEKISIPAMMSTASFFIFAFHKPVQVIVRRVFFSVCHPQNEVMLCLAIFIVPAIVILIALAAFYIIKKYLPCLSFLNGYRL